MPNGRGMSNANIDQYDRQFLSLSLPLDVAELYPRTARRRLIYFFFTLALFSLSLNTIRLLSPYDYANMSPCQLELYSHTVLIFVDGGSQQQPALGKGSGKTTSSICCCWPWWWVLWQSKLGRERHHSASWLDGAGRPADYSCHPPSPGVAWRTLCASLLLAASWL